MNAKTATIREAAQFVITNPRVKVGPGTKVKFDRRMKNTIRLLKDEDQRRFNVADIDFHHEHVYDPAFPNEGERPNTLVTSLISTEIKNYSDMSFGYETVVLFQCRVRLEDWENFNFKGKESRAAVALHDHLEKEIAASADRGMQRIQKAIAG